MIIYDYMMVYEYYMILYDYIRYYKNVFNFFPA